jgi:uncharacterized protein DUF2721
MPVKLLIDLVPVLQVAVGPVILISGVGLLLLTLTNRFGRAVDRSRQLAREMKSAPVSGQKLLEGQVEILYRRAKLIRLSIILAAFSLLLASGLIIALFLSALLKLEIATLICLLFIGCMLALILALCSFIQEIQLSLAALKLELRED